MRQYTFLILALLGCAVLFLDRDTSSFVPQPNSVRVAVHSRDCTRNVSGPSMSRASVLATLRARELRCRVAELQARMHASIAMLQAEKACWLNRLNMKLHGRVSAAASPAWRDVQDDAQQLARLLGLCTQEPV